MRKLFKRMCIALLTVLIMGTAWGANAYFDQMFENLGYQQVPGFYTVIVDTKGEEHRFDGVLNIATLENYEEIMSISSYRIYSGDAVVMEVELRELEKAATAPTATMPRSLMWMPNTRAFSPV